MREQDISSELQERVIAAGRGNTPLVIRGGDSKAFYGREASGEWLDVSQHAGIINYEPTELVITARAGTPLAVIEHTLASRQQMLPFEPPHYGGNATLGGTIACNLSGPRRAYAGAARDFVLGCKILNGKGEILSFGGEVMKNVAGYDVSRLMAGAMGTLGILLEVSLKVLPLPESEITLTHPIDLSRALKKIHRIAQFDRPVSATCFDGDTLYIRLSGSEGAVSAGRQAIGGDALGADQAFWHRLKEQRHGFFTSEQPLWRLSVASDTPPMALDGKWLYEWGGALRWLISNAAANHVQAAAESAGGHASCFRRRQQHDVFHPLPAALMAIHKKLKHAFDPQHILNRGRMYPEI